MAKTCSFGVALSRWIALRVSFRICFAALSFSMSWRTLL